MDIRETISQIKPFLPVIQIIVASLLIALILLQQRGEGLGSAFGQSQSFYGTIRGMEKKISLLTAVLGFVFIAAALLNLLV